MKRHLIWIIAGAAAIGVAVPAFAAVQPASTPDDNGIPGEVRANCDEAEHAGDAECLVVTVPATSKVTVSIPSVPTTASATAGTVPDNTVPANTVPSNTVPDNTVPDSSVPSSTVPDNSVANSLPGDISGPCDEAEHANDPRCTGAAPSDDDSGRHRGDDDSSGHGGGDDSGRHRGDDDSSGHGGGDDDSSGHGSDDN
jgi:hypothetical protein